MTATSFATGSRALAAYGGEAVWRESGAVEADVAAGGLLFRWKRMRPLPRMVVRADTANPILRLDPVDHDGHVGVLDGRSVRIETRDGALVDSRADARDRFPYGRRLISWDSLDLTYFLGYALWNYLTLPALLLRDDIAWREVAGSTLEAEFPSHLPTHCQRQTFYFDADTGLLDRLDYTAEVFGGWAHAAHLVTEHQERDGVRFASSRRVVPRVGSTALDGPPLIWAEVRDAQLLPLVSPSDERASTRPTQGLPRRARDAPGCRTCRPRGAAGR